MAILCTTYKLVFRAIDSDQYDTRWEFPCDDHGIPYYNSMPEYRKEEYEQCLKGEVWPGTDWAVKVQPPVLEVRYLWYIHRVTEEEAAALDYKEDVWR